MNQIRKAVVSGTFYPDNLKRLRADIERYLKEAVFDPIHGDIVGVISPHAGYVYSGPVAAYGYKAISGKVYDTVVVIAPSHRKYFEGAAVMEKGGYRTPLGVVGVDEGFAGEMIKRTDIVHGDMDAHSGEHSLEVQVPFLQSVLGDFRLVPVIMGSQDPRSCERLASAIHGVIAGAGGRVLVVGSTDLSHYHPRDMAAKLDGVAVRRLGDFDYQGLISDLNENRCEACGSGPMITTMMIAKSMGATRSLVMKYADSGDVSGDRSAVVGYVSGIFIKER